MTLLGDILRNNNVTLRPSSPGGGVAPVFPTDIPLEWLQCKAERDRLCVTQTTF